MTAGHAQTAITVPNYSFESTSTDTLGIARPDSWSGGGFVQESPIGGLTTSANGQYGPLVGQTAQGTHFLSIQGNYGAAPESLLLSSVPIAAGETFTLTVAVGNRYGFENSNPNFYIDNIALTLDGNIVATNVAPATSPTAGAFGDVTVSYTALTADVGSTLGIELLDPTSNVYFYDNVRLTEVGGEAVVPEPSTWALLIGGALALVGVSRFKRQV